MGSDTISDSQGHRQKSEDDGGMGIQYQGHKNEKKITWETFGLP